MKKQDVKLTMDRSLISNTIHEVCKEGVSLLKKKSFEQTDHSKLKLMRNLGTFVNSGVSMIQQETAQQRMVLIRDRMDQLGYKDEPKKISK